VISYAYCDIYYTMLLYGTTTDFGDWNCLLLHCPFMH